MLALDGEGRDAFRILDGARLLQGRLGLLAGAQPVGVPGVELAQVPAGPLGPDVTCIDSDLPGCGFLNLGFEYEGQREDCMNGISVERVAATSSSKVETSSRSPIQFSRLTRWSFIQKGCSSAFRTGQPACPGVARSQDSQQTDSVADAARRARDAKKNAAKPSTAKPSKVITNDDVPPSATSDAVNVGAPAKLETEPPTQSSVAAVDSAPVVRSTAAMLFRSEPPACVNSPPKKSFEPITSTA